MSRKRSSKKAGRKPNEGGRVPRLPAIKFEDFADADAVFLQHISEEEFRPSVSKMVEIPGNSESKPARKSRAGDTRLEVDLHGLTLSEAIQCLDAAIAKALAGAQREVTIKVITGKGLHSGPGGGVLAREIHSYVSARYGLIISRIDASPAEALLGGVPLRGYFVVTLMPRA